MSTIRVAVAEDHPLYRDGLVRALGSAPRRVQVVGEARDGSEALVLVERTMPDVILMDIKMLGMNGIEATRHIKKEWPQVHVIALSAYDDEDYIYEIIKAGAEGYLLKDAESATILGGIEAVMRGDTLIHPNVARKMLRQFAELAQNASRRTEDLYDGLTDRELEVLQLIARGSTNREAAAQLVISERTVDNHVRSIYRKLNIVDRSQAVLYAVRKGLIQLDQTVAGHK